MRSERVWFTNYPVFLSRHENKWIWSPLQLRSFSQGWRGRLFGPVACPCESGEKAAAYITWEDSFKSLFCSKELCCLILFFLKMLYVARWCCLLLPHCSLLACTTFPRLGKVLYKLHTGYLLVWESGPGQEDLTALATGAPPAWEVGIGVGSGTVLEPCTNNWND